MDQLQLPPNSGNKISPVILCLGTLGQVKLAKKRKLAIWWLEASAQLGQPQRTLQTASTCTRKYETTRVNNTQTRTQLRPHQKLVLQRRTLAASYNRYLLTSQLKIKL